MNWAFLKQRSLVAAQVLTSPGHYPEQHTLFHHTCLSIKLHNYITKRPIKSSNTTADLFPPHAAFLWSVGAYYWWGYQSFGSPMKYHISRLYTISQWNTVHAYFRPSSIPFQVGRALVNGFSPWRSSFAATVVHVCFFYGKFTKGQISLLKLRFPLANNTELMHHIHSSNKQE